MNNRRRFFGPSFFIASRPGIPFPFVGISCAKCGRHSNYSRDNFLELVGAETELPDALERICADCPQRQSAVTYDQCMALSPDLAAKAAE